jgi:16S rRNA (cytosine967-C5)-methyltransferase
VRGAGSPEGLTSFQEGLFTVQDAAAQRVGRLCGAAPGEDILDACAGVGGKTTHLAELAIQAGGPARVVAADKSRRKLDLCEDTTRRLGLSGIRVLVADLTAAAPSTTPGDYDRVLLDAPCSGLGVLRRHPEAKWRPPPDIAELAALQARLLAALAPRVRPGGVLVYSVCTFTNEEGPAQMAAFLAAHPHFRATGELRTWPHRDGSDAFFAVRLQRIA